MDDTQTEDRAYRFNPDPDWQQYVASLEPLIEWISLKYCSRDEALREDACQEARIALYTIFPEEVRASLNKPLTTSWEEFLERFCGRVIRNSILSMMDSYPKGPWDIGRTRSMKDRKTGNTKKVYLPPRYTSLDYLMDEHGMQVDEHGAISWPHPADDGLVAEALPSTVAKHYGTSKYWSPAVEDLDAYAPKEHEDE